MRVLLDEMIARVVAEQLRANGHDAVAVQEPECAHLRGIDDCVLLGHAADDRRAVVTDNVPDFFRCHQRRVEVGRSHHGLVLFTNDAFPRHRHELFGSHLIVAVGKLIEEKPGDDPSGWIRWLTSRSANGV